MLQAKNGKIYAIIAAVCLLLYGGYRVWITVRFSPYYGFEFSSILMLIFSALYLALGILLLIGRKNIAFVIVSAAAAVAQICSLIFASDPDIPVWFLSLLRIAVLGFFFISEVAPSLKGKRKTIYKYWFAPGVLGLICMGLGVYYNYSSFSSLGSSYSIDVFLLSDMPYLVFAVGLLFTGLWLKVTIDYEPVSVKREHINGESVEAAPESLDGQKLLRPWQYFWLNLLYAVPVVGWVFLLIHAFDTTNINRRYFARSFFCLLLIAGILGAIAAMIMLAIGVF